MRAIRVRNHIQIPINMKTISKFSAVTIASAVLSSMAYADRVVKRIDHPNGPDTYAYVDAESADNFPGATIANPYGRYERGRVVIIPERRFVPVDRDARRYSYTEREVIYAPVERW